MIGPDLRRVPAVVKGERFENLVYRIGLVAHMTWAWRDANRAPTLFCKSVTPQSSQIRSLPCERATS
jgi:hypothetical protein